MKKFEGKTVVVTVEEFGAIDGFYNNAGIEGKQTPMIEYDTEIFKKVIDINLLGVAPGAIMTPMVEEAFRQVNPDDPQAAEKEYASRNPTKRLGTPAEVAKVVSFLLSDDNGYLNGQIIAIDGGEANFYGNEKE